MMMSAGLFMLLIVVVIIVAVLAFEVWMFIDAIQNPALSSNQRALWILGMLLLHPFVAMAYYFVARSGVSRP